MESRSLMAIRQLIDAGRTLIYIQSPEEERILLLLTALARHPGGDKPGLFTWSITEGLWKDGKACRNQPEGARGILDFVIGHEDAAFFLLKDFHEFIRDSAEIRRRLRDVYHSCLHSAKHIVICSPVKTIPSEIEREVAFLKMPMPDITEMLELVREEVRALEAAIRHSGGTPPPPITEDAVYILARSLQGLTFDEARHAIRFATARHGGLDASVMPLLQEEKRLLVRKTGLMEYLPDTIGIDQLGGLDVLKKWLIQRRDLFFSRDSISADIVPKGVLMMGVSGCGKSLSARIVSSVFGLPLYRVDMSQIFAAGMGNAERVFAEACRTMEEIAPAVIWYDEIENAITRQHLDTSGVLDRIFGYFLTWMQEKPKGLFIAATANRIDLLPAEMIRKGRFDQVFFIDLPDYNERMEIFKIHLLRRHIDLAGLSMDLATIRTEGCTGAEIEQCVIATLTSARLANQPVTDKFLLPAIEDIVPLSKTMQEQVKHIRSWASDRAINASTKTRRSSHG